MTEPMTKGENEKFCFSCGKVVNVDVTFCPHCGVSQSNSGAKQPVQPPAVQASAAPPAVQPVQVSPEKKQEAFGLLALLLPVGGAFLVMFWIGNMNILESPGTKLGGIVAGVIALSAVFVAIEASQVGAGGPSDINEKGKKREGPVTWFFALLMIWLFAFPMWMGRRKKYGLNNLSGVGVLVTLVFVGTLVFMNYAIEQQKGQALQHMQELQDRFR